MSAARLARQAVRAAQRLLPGSTDGFVVLGYHLVGAGTGSPVDLDANVFEGQLDEVARWAEVVPLDADGLASGADAASAGARASGVADGRSAGAPVRPRVALTFDDAYANFFERAWPLLRERGLPATLYVPVGFVDGSRGAPITGTEALAPCTWDQLERMRADGLRVGSHTRWHRNLRALEREPAALADEVVRSRALLEQRLGAPIESFCYPQAKVGPAAEALVRATYRTAVIGGGVQNRRARWNPHRIARVSLRRDMPRSVRPILHARVWLEEWLADRYRRWRR